MIVPLTKGDAMRFPHRRGSITGSNYFNLFPEHDTSVLFQKELE
jgi:hypothetical protein